jgi:hypothetical protein
MNKEEIEKKIENLKSNFQCLEHWSIDYVDEGGNDKVEILPTLECAIIYPPSNLNEVDWNEYLMHEILHVVFYLMADEKDVWEDIIITEICQLIWPEKFNVQNKS